MDALTLFDSHAHYNDRRFGEEFEGGGRGALLRAHEEGVAFFCNVGSSVRTSEESVRLAEEFDFVEAAAGWTEIAALYISDASHPGGAHAVGLKYDGTLVAAGNNDYGQCEF